MINILKVKQITHIAPCGTNMYSFDVDDLMPSAYALRSCFVCGSLPREYYLAEAEGGAAMLFFKQTVIIFANNVSEMYDLFVEDYVASLRLELSDQKAIDRSRQAEKLNCENLLDAVKAAFVELPQPLEALEILPWWQEVAMYFFNFDIISLTESVDGVWKRKCTLATAPTTANSDGSQSNVPRIRVLLRVDAVNVL